MISFVIVQGTLKDWILSLSFLQENWQITKQVH